MTFTHTGGWVSTPCDDPSVWVGTVNADCFLEITSADFSLVGGTITPPVPDATFGPNVDTNAGPWALGIGSSGSVSYQFSFPGLVGSRNLTVRATPYNPPRLVGRNFSGFPTVGTSGAFAIGSPGSGSIGDVQIAHWSSRSGATDSSSWTGWTLLNRTTYQSPTFGGQWIVDEIWWRPSSSSSAAGTATSGSWQAEIYSFDNLQSPLIGSSIDVNLGFGPTATLSVTATDPGSWFYLDRDFNNNSSSQSVSGITGPPFSMPYVLPDRASSGAQTLTVPQGGLVGGDNVTSGLILAALLQSTVDLTGFLSPCFLTQGVFSGIPVGQSFAVGVQSTST